MGVLGSCGVLVSVSQTLVVPLLPLFPGITGSPPTDVSWLLTVTLLTGAVFTPLLGRAGDMYGKRRVLLIALSSMVIGSLFCALSSALPVLIVGRAFQGAAVAVVPLGISILRDELPARRVIPAIARGEFTRPAVLAQLVMMVLMAIYVALGVKSFKAARRARLAR